MGIFANLSANRKIIRRLEALEDAYDTLPKLQKQFGNLDLEFSNLFGQVRKLSARIEKRARIIEEAQQDTGADPEPSLEPASGVPDLTPAQLAWQRRIAAERRRVGS